MEGKMEFLKDTLKGVVVGIANAIPGVSGGTMMVSMGVYDNIIYCITHLFKELAKCIRILLPYIVGMLIGIVGLAFGIKYLDANFPFQTRMVFIGLILGGVPAIWNRVKKSTAGAGNIIVFLLFFVAIIAMQYFGNDGTDVTLEIGVVSLIKIFLIGILASATMVIPGVSGSMMLMILGYYNPIMTAITDFVSGVTKGNFEQALHVAAFLIPFGLGVVIGVFLIAKIIELLLAKWEGLTYAAILGLVASSPVVVLMGTALAGLGAVTIVTGVIALVLGIAVALKMGD